MSLDLSLSENEEMLKNTALSFLEREVPKDVMMDIHDSDTGYTEDIWQKMVDMGWLGIIIPEEYGGVEYPLTSAGVLFETLGTGPLPGPYFSSSILGSLIVIESANEDQKKEIDDLSPMAMLRLIRFAPAGHKYFVTGTALEEYFDKSFEKKGGMTPAMSKQMGWEQ